MSDTSDSAASRNLSDASPRLSAGDKSMPAGDKSMPAGDKSIPAGDSPLLGIDDLSDASDSVVSVLASLDCG